MLRNFRTPLFASLLLLGSCLPVWAQVTYVDATSGPAGNTTLASGATFTPPLNGTTGKDNNWEQRTPFASSGNIFEASGEVFEDAPQVRTKLTGLIPNRAYDVRVHFWDGSGPNPDWSIRAGFSPATMNLYANGVDSDAADLGAIGSGLASALTYATAPTVFVEVDRTQYAGLVGTTSADANGELLVYIDDLPSPASVNNRTWYDGLSVEVFRGLTLQVNTTTGGISITNGDTNTHSFNYYEIRSSSGSLNRAGWSSIDGAGPATSTSWEKAGGSSASILSETNLLGSAALDPAQQVSLGAAYAGTGLSDQDLVFSYGLPDGTLRTGFVKYVTGGGVPGDFNSDGEVNASDYTRWRDNLGVASELAIGGNGDGLNGVDTADFALWQSRFGTNAGALAAAAVPEPAAGTLALLVVITASGSTIARRCLGAR